MSATVYRDVEFQGTFARMSPGFVSGRELRGYRHQSAYGSGEDLDNAISSIRVEPNTIVALYGGHSATASAGSRVLVGPVEVADLGALNMADKISAIHVLTFKEYNSGRPRGGGATIYTGYEGGGKYSDLARGEYNAARLSSEEVKFPVDRLRSIQVSSNVIAILYNGPNFDTASDAVVVAGPVTVGDLDRLGLIDRVSSIKIMYTDPYDNPRHQSLRSQSLPADTSSRYHPPQGAHRPWPKYRTRYRSALAAVLEESDLNQTGAAEPTPPPPPPTSPTPPPPQLQAPPTPPPPTTMLRVVFIILLTIMAMMGLLLYRSSNASLVQSAKTPPATGWINFDNNTSA
jgi:hypothetical protein